MSYFDNGIIIGDEASPTIFDSIYFSVVTFSSLGYGDIQPSGLSRAIAVVEVLSGLVILALIVARLASDRSSAHARILYQGDSLRVMKEFEDRLRDQIAELTDANEKGDVRRIEIVARGLNTHLVGMRSYYSLQKQIGDIEEEWARKVSIRLANAIIEVSNIHLDIAVSPVASHIALNRLEKSFEISRTIIEMIGDAHGCEHVKGIKQRLMNLQKGFYKRRSPEHKTRLIITEKLKDLIRDRLPASEWPKNIHKKIAKQMGLSNNTIQRTIYAILDDNENQP